MNIKLGSIIKNRYQLLSCLREGDYSATYKAEDLQMRSQVAIKIISLSLLIFINIFKVMIDSNTTAEELEKLAQTEIPNICRQIAKHPNAPPRLFKKRKFSVLSV